MPDPHQPPAPAGYVYAIGADGRLEEVGQLARGAGVYAKARAALASLRDALGEMPLPIAVGGDRLAETVGDVAARHLSTLGRLVDVHELAGRESAGTPTGAPGPPQAIVHAPAAGELDAYARHRALLAEADRNFGAPIGRGMVDAGPGDPGVDMSRPDDHGIIRRLP